MDINALDKTKFSTNIHEIVIDWDYTYTPLQKQNKRGWPEIRIGKKLCNKKKVTGPVTGSGDP
jgi:hypothetical protein